MIFIDDYKTYVEEIKDSISEINEVVLAVTEKHLIKKLKDKSGVVLCAIHPSYGSNSDDIDNKRDMNIIMFFLIENIETSNVTETNEVLHYKKMQLIAKAIRTKITEDSRICNHIFKLLKLGSINIDTVYSEFGKYNGYSIMFSVDNIEK